MFEHSGPELRFWGGDGKEKTDSVIKGPELSIIK